MSVQLCIWICLILSAGPQAARADDCSAASNADREALAAAIAQLQARIVARTGSPWRPGTDWPYYPDAAFLSGQSPSTLWNYLYNEYIDRAVGADSGTYFLDVTDPAENPFVTESGFIDDDTDPFVKTQRADLKPTVDCGCSGNADNQNWCKIRLYIANLNSKLTSHLSVIKYTIPGIGYAVRNYHGTTVNCVPANDLDGAITLAYGNAAGSANAISHIQHYSEHAGVKNYVSSIQSNCQNNPLNIFVTVDVTLQQALVTLPSFSGTAKVKINIKSNSSSVTSRELESVALVPDRTTEFRLGSLGYQRIVGANPGDTTEVYKSIAAVYLNVANFPFLTVNTDALPEYTGNPIETSDVVAVLGTGGYAGGQSNASGPNPVSCDPVALATGHKVERAIDLTVPTNGADFELSREYTSDNTYLEDTGGSVAGIGWGLSTNLYFRARSNGSNPVKLSLEGFPLSQRLEFFLASNLSDPREVDGPSTQTVEKPDPVTIHGTAHHVIRLQEPGEWTREFECNSTIVAGDIMYLLREIDVYGNSRLYEWSEAGVGLVRRPVRIILQDVPGGTVYTGGPTSTEIRFDWIGSGQTNEGKIDKVEVVRTDPATGSEVITQSVDYVYFSSGMSSDVGKAGDLVQVVRKTRLSDGSYYPEVTQYRYHQTSDPANSPDGSIYGADHQLKAVILPAEVEYAAFRYHKTTTGTPPQDRVESYAAILCTLSDDVAITSTTDSNESPETLDVNDIFSKLLGYETSGNKRTAIQFSLTGACACSGAKLTYVYDQTSTNPYQKTVTITESQWNGSAYSTYRETKHTLEPLNPANQTDVYFKKESRIYAAGAPSNAWVTTYSYDSNGQMIAERLPSGLENRFHYTNRRLDGIGYKLPGQSSSDPYWTSKTLFGSMPTLDVPGLAQSRVWLPSKVYKYTTALNDSVFPPADPGSSTTVEVANFSYWFHSTAAPTGFESTDAVSISDITNERELSAENGPSGVTHQIDFFDHRGNNIWTRLPDSALVHRQYDGATGVLVLNVENANPAESQGTNATRYRGLNMTQIDGKEDVALLGLAFGRFAQDLHVPGASGQAVGDLTTHYTIDLLGRTTEIIRPGGKLIEGFADGVSTSIERVMQPVATERSTNPGILYYAEVHHPAVDESQYDGPIIYSVMNASGQAISRDSINAADTSKLLSRSVTFLNAARLPIRTVSASRVSGSSVESGALDTTTFEYDTLGRLKHSKTPNGTFTGYTYDVRDRVLTESVGTSTTSLHTTTEYFYDTGNANATPGFGDGNLTLIRTHPTTSSTNDRDTRRWYDSRNRLRAVIPPLAPYSYTVYDDLNRPISESLYSSEPSDAQTPAAVTARGKHTEIKYSQRGLVYQTRTAVTPTSASTDFLQSNVWFDDAGRSIAELNPTSPSIKRVYDGLGRLVQTSITDHGGDDAPGTTGNYEDAINTTGDKVYEQSFITYARHTEANSGVVLFEQSLKRPHDSTATGALSPSIAVATYVGYAYDSFNRRTHSVDLGTNVSGDATVLVSGGLQPTTALCNPSPSASVKTQLVTKTIYGARGLVERTIDPMEFSTWLAYDARNRLIGTVENSSTAIAFEWDTDYWKIPSSVTLAANVRVNTTSYDSSGNKRKEVAFNRLPTTSVELQVTKYNYDTTSDAESLLKSKDTLASIEYPQVSSVENEVVFSHNWLGEVSEALDQNGTAHIYTHDKLGRVTLDEVKTFGTDIDTTVKSIATTYDNFNRQSGVTANTATPTVQNEVKFTYSPLWQVATVVQDPDSAESSNAMVVGYTYGTSASANYSRLETLTYPDSREYVYTYDEIQRLYKLTQDDGDIFSGAYSFFGVSTLAYADYGVQDIQLDRTFDNAAVTRRAAGYTTGTFGRYAGLDRFGRVIRQAWLDGDLTKVYNSNPARPNVPEILNETYEYDNNSNRNVRTDERHGRKQAIHTELFEYDPQNRLGLVKHNPLSGTGAYQTYESWTLDAVSNWRSFSHDEDRDQSMGSGETVARTFTIANDITNGNALNYANGMLRKIDRPTGSGKDRFTYDAWGRMVKHEVFNGSTATITNTYEYNGLGWRTRQTTQNASSVVTEKRWFFYDASWCLLEEHVQDVANTKDWLLQEFHGLQGMDDPVFRRVRVLDTGSASLGSTRPAHWDASGVITADKDFYHITDAQGSTRAMIGSSWKSEVIERVNYDAYGRATHRWAGSVLAGDGPAVTEADHDYLKDLYDYDLADSQYDVDCDLNRDGFIDETDADYLDTQLGFSGLEPGAIGATGELLPWNTRGFCGYVYAPEAARYCVRNRWYDAGPSLAMGRWLQRDPAGYVDGMNLFEYCASGPVGSSDPMGLVGTDIAAEVRAESYRGPNAASKALSNYADRWTSGAKFIAGSIGDGNTARNIGSGVSGIWDGFTGSGYAEDAKIEMSLRNAAARQFSLDMRNGLDPCAALRLRSIADSQSDSDFAFLRGVHGLERTMFEQTLNIPFLAAGEFTKAAQLFAEGATAAEAAKGAFAVASLSASAPGAKVAVSGVSATELAGRLTPSEMALLQTKQGTEFAQIYLTGPGRAGGGGTYYLIQGSAGRVPIPIGSNVRWINHTHPETLNGGLVPLQASLDDLRVLRRLQQAGSPQETSQIVPEVGTPFNFRR